MAESPHAAIQPIIPFTVVIPTLYGQMMVNRYDINQTNALFKNGWAVDHAAISNMAQFVRGKKPDPVFLDIGANMGTYTIAMATVVGPGGKVHCFEPQRLIYNLLVGSVALNSFTNVYCHNVALGDQEGEIEIPQYDYHKPMNFGSVEFTPEQREPLPQARGHDPSRAEMVPLTTLDRYNFPRVDVMKVDAEGMEVEVLAGADATIRRCRPIMVVEALKANSAELRERLLSFERYKIEKMKMDYLATPLELADRIKIEPGAL